MKNLAGVADADKTMLEELQGAGAEVVTDQKSEGEVPYSVVGKVGPFTLTRAWYYWVASTEDDQGLDVDVATALHNKEYPTDEGIPNQGRGAPQAETYGQVVRVAGHCGCPPPNEWAEHYDADGLVLVLDPEGKKKAQWEQVAGDVPSMKTKMDRLRFVDTLEGNVDRSVVRSYHIDSQEGLNEFVRTVQETL